MLHNLTFNRTDRIILRHLKRFREGRQKVAEVIERICRKENIDPQDLRMHSRIKRICQIGAQIVYQSVENFGISLAEVTRQVGVSTLAISEALDKKMKDQFNSVTTSLKFSYIYFHRGGILQTRR